jgi:DNA-binding transcriptional MerR regulator
MDHTYLTIGAFAARAGVSVRTLQYYDRIDLLKPSALSDGGRRLYTEHDFPRLQQIVTFKLIGLSLDQIKGLLVTDASGILKTLLHQRQALEDKRRQLDQIIRALDSAQQAVQSAEGVDLQRFADIIKEVVMSADTDWLGHFLTADQQAQLIQAGAGHSLADQKREGLAFKQLFDSVHAYLDGEPDDERARVLADRWAQLMRAYAQGDESLQANLEAAYAQLAARDGLSGDVRTWLESLQTAAIFAQRRA